MFPGKTRRYSADEYHGIVHKILRIVQSFSANCAVVPSYSTKPSFGDVDIVFVPSVSITRALLADAFGCGEYVSHNGGVWSLVYEQFQVDLISTSAIDYNSAIRYFSFQDRSNLIGRIHHKFGLKHGHDGLWFPVRSNDHVLGNILLTRDLRLSETFADVNPIDNFDTLEEIFEAVAASKYFNPDIFLLENRNHTARVRDRKRATYTAFLEWCKTQTVKTEFYQFDPDKTVYHRKIFKAFPHAKAEFDELWRRKFEIEAAALKFNGDIVKELTGRENVRLGELMKVLKVRLTPAVVNTMTDADINAVILEQHNQLEIQNAS